MATISALNTIVLDQQKQIETLTALMDNMVVASSSVMSSTSGMIRPHSLWAALQQFKAEAMCGENEINKMKRLRVAAEAAKAATTIAANFRGNKARAHLVQAIEDELARVAAAEKKKTPKKSRWARREEEAAIASVAALEIEANAVAVKQAKEDELLRVKITKRPGDVHKGQDIHAECDECHTKIFGEHDNCQVCNRRGVSGYKFKEEEEKDTCLSKMIKKAHMAGANIIVKAGPKAKWYLKSCRIENLDREIERAKCGGSRRIQAVNRATMYIVDLN
jgi:hypothetical protein